MAICSVKSAFLGSLADFVILEEISSFLEEIPSEGQKDVFRCLNPKDFEIKEF